jgi:hypothetical protein
MDPFFLSLQLLFMIPDVFEKSQAMQCIAASWAARPESFAELAGQMEP